MRKINYFLAICLLVLVCSCNDSNEMIENDSSSDDISLRDYENENDDDYEVPLEIEITDDEYEAGNKNYCYWKVTSTTCPAGVVPKYKAGDLICYPCKEVDDGDGGKVEVCTSDWGRIIRLNPSRNFGDGCATYGTTVNTCANNHNCAAKYNHQ